MALGTLPLSLPEDCNVRGGSIEVNRTESFVL